MKTNYRPRNNVLVSNRRRLGLVLGILVLGIIIFSFLRGPITSIVSPIWKSSNVFSRVFSDTWNLFQSKENLVNENQVLNEKLLSYNALPVSSRALEDSRDQILAEFQRGSTTAGIASSVLVHPPETPYDVLVIDAGSAEGVILGDRVFLPEGGEIGKVSEVSTHNSRVALYSGSGQSTDAVLERNSLPVTLIGRGAGNFEFDLPRSVAVVVGDKILSPSIRSEMMAVVSDVESEPTDSQVHVLAQSVVNVFTLRFVIVKP